MARNTGDRTCVRNVNVSDANIGNTQAHNEREKKSYVNPDIVPERAELNVHFKAPTDDYVGMFSKIVDVLRELYNKYLDLINSFNRLNDSYNRLQQRYSSLDASFDRLAEENKGLQQVAADYDALCRGYGADRVDEQVRAIREREEEQKRQRRMFRHSRNIGVR